MKVGLYVNDTTHNAGEQIMNNLAGISSSLPQTISNEVTTAILDYPGVKISIYPEKDIIEACEEDTIFVPYYSDVGTENEKVIITTTFET